MIVRMAGFARDALGRKTLVLVACRAGKRLMFAEQGKAGQRVVKRDLFLPADRIVTTCAICSEFGLVDIIVQVAAYTGDGELHDARGLLVTGIAREWLVSTAQGKSGHCVVVETALFPVPAVVAACAIGSVAAFVNIVLHMA